MKSTQSYTFVRNKKQISLSKQNLITSLQLKDPTILSKISILPNLSINDTSINSYIKLLTQILTTIKVDLKTKEKIYYLLCYFLNVRKGDEEIIREFLGEFKKLEESTLFKVKMATILFKSVEHKEFKKQLLIESIKLLAKESKLANLVSLLQTIDPILFQLNLSESDLISIYSISIESLEKIPIYKNLTIHLILKLLKLPIDKLDPVVVEKSLLYLIQNGGINQQIVTLSQSNLTQTLTFSLFQLLLAGDLQVYYHLLKQKEQDILKLNLNLPQYQRQLKINSIAKLATNNKTLTYNELIKKLNIPKEQVEEYIIAAIQNNFISARIDEIEEVVIVEEIKSKYFSQDEWESILQGVQGLERKLERFVGERKEKEEKV